MNKPMDVRMVRGFSLIEVLVALVVLSIGLLGTAQMQLVALSEIGTASKRSLAAVEAAGLAASMHVNRAYWAGGLAPTSFTITGTTISDTGLAQAVNCAGTAANCSPSQLAAYDVQAWGAEVAQVLPAPSSTIACLATSGAPADCTVTIMWVEHSVAINVQQGQSNSSPLAPTYVLHVEP